MLKEGRMIHKSIVEQDFELYSSDKNRGLDGNSMTNITKQTGIKDCPIDTDEMLLVDLKTKDNINPISVLKKILIPLDYKFDIKKPFQ